MVETLLVPVQIHKSDISETMSSILVLLAAGLASMACVRAACDAMVLQQNFDKYTGEYQPWDKAMGQQDMPGFKFLKLQTAGNSMAGKGNYRSTNPQGALQLHATSACYICFLLLP
jgi:hypothetical protein